MTAGRNKVEVMEAWELIRAFVERLDAGDDRITAALAVMRETCEAAVEPEVKVPCVHDAAKAFLEGPAACKRCGEPVAYDGAVYCGAACCALDEASR